MFFTENSANIKRLRGVRLHLTEDAFEVAEPDNCPIEQIVNYQDVNLSYKILINMDLYDKMDNTNKAALILHESFYRLLREDSHEKNSIRTRRAIGLIMDLKSLPATRDLLVTPSQRRMLCQQSGNLYNKTKIYLVESDMYGGKKLLTAVPEIIGGVYFIGRGRIGYYSEMTLDEAIAKGEPLWESIEDNSDIEKTVRGEVQFLFKNGVITANVNVKNFENGRAPFQTSLTCKLQ